MSVRMFSEFSHTLFDILPKLLKVDIKVSLDRSQLVNNDLLNELSLEPIQLLSWVHGIDCVHFFIYLVHLLLAGVKCYLQLDQLLF